MQLAKIKTPAGVCRIHYNNKGVPLVPLLYIYRTLQTTELDLTQIQVWDKWHLV
jgi:hypothetical protein